MNALLFTNAIIFDGDTFVDADSLRVADGVVTEIGAQLTAGHGEQVIDVEQKWLLPGLVDCHVHFREPGLVRKEGYVFGLSLIHI